MAEKVKQILVDPFTCKVELIEIEQDNVRDIYKVLGTTELFGEGFVDGNTDLLLVDDNGLRRGHKRFAVVTGHPSPIFGKFLITSAGEEAESAPPKMSLDYYRKNIEFFHLESASFEQSLAVSLGRHQGNGAH